MFYKAKRKTNENFSLVFYIVKKSLRVTPIKVVSFMEWLKDLPSASDLASVQRDLVLFFRGLKKIKPPDLGGFIYGAANET